MTETRGIVVVGGGLVGSLLSTFLAEHGHDVTVFERGPDLRSSSGAGGRSINLVLTRRGIRALARVGLERGAMELTVPVTGRMMHGLDGSLQFQPYGKDDTECNYSVSRAGLNRYLIRSATERGVKLRCDSRLRGADVQANLLRFEDAAGRPFQVRPRVVFGADGAGSALRRAFSSVAGFNDDSKLEAHGYKELSIPAGDGGAFRIARHALHIWPRRDLMLMALPNLDGSFTVTLFAPLTGSAGFDGLETPDDVVTLFRRHFPDAIPLIPDLTEAFFANPTGKLGTVRCSPWNSGGGALLIGDAAHAIVPFFGQGMNSGFEDCTILDGLLRGRGGDDWRTVFDAFSRKRKPDAEAIADMALENFVEMRDSVADPAFLLAKQVDHRLEQIMPEAYRSRYSMVMYSQIPFSVAFEAGEIQRGIRDELCRDIRSADEVDLERARKLIEERLTPFLDERGVSLDY